MKKELKQILREYGIRQEEMYSRFGFHFEDLTKEKLEDVKRQLKEMY